jgi:predicted anti-sigma-YlaC factor YlaD
MNCDDIDKALDIGAISGSPSHQVNEHLNRCARCRKLVTALSLPRSQDSLPATTLQQIEIQLLSDLRPVRRTKKEYLLAALAVIFFGCVAFGVSRVGAFALGVMSPLQAAVMLAAVPIGAVLAADSLVNQIMPGSLHRIVPGVLPLAVTISLAIATVVLFHFQHEQHFWAASWWCIRTGTKFGALAAPPLWFVLRRGAVLSPTMTGLASGLFAGLLGTMVLEIHCPILDAWHILFAHLGVLVILTTIGLGVGFAVENWSGWRKNETNDRTA